MYYFLVKYLQRLFVCVCRSFVLNLFLFVSYIILFYDKFNTWITWPPDRFFDLCLTFSLCSSFFRWSSSISSCLLFLSSSSFLILKQQITLNISFSPKLLSEAGSIWTSRVVAKVNVGGSTFFCSLEQRKSVNCFSLASANVTFPPWYIKRQYTDY